METETKKVIHAFLYKKDQNLARLENIITF